MPALIAELLDIYVGQFLKDTTPTDTGSHRLLGASPDDGSSIEHFYFEDVIYAALFIVCVFCAGELFNFFTLPSLIGEILVGCMAGPLFIDFVPEYLAFMLLGS